MQTALRSLWRLRTLAWTRVVAAAVVLSLGTGSIALAAKNAHKAKHHGGATLSISKQTWGSAHGQAVDLYTLRNDNGMIVKITNYGGVVQSIWVPDRTGQLKNVALGFPTLSDYVNDFENQPWPAAGGSGDTYFGGIIGRYANRIANHSFTLNGTPISSLATTARTTSTRCTAGRMRTTRRCGRRRLRGSRTRSH